MNYKNNGGRRDAKKAEQVFNKILEDVEFYDIFEELTPDIVTTKERRSIDNLLEEVSEYEVYIFANFDICNFTKYKREHKDWTHLLERYLETIRAPGPDWAISKFWKFNGDSLTFRRKIKCVSEVCEFIALVQVNLDKLQEYLNDNISEKRVFIKAGVWIAGFSNDKSKKSVNANNVRISVANRDEFVGENIDEGFRLSSCSKAGKLVIDPKIVALLYLYEELLVEYKQGNLMRDQYSTKLKHHSDSIRTIISRTITEDIENNNQGGEGKTSEDKVQGIINKFFNQDDYSKNICRKFYLMEYSKCKGVWDDRDYPIFWYIESVENCEFIYDEEVDNKKLREHHLYKDIFLHYTYNDEFKKKLENISKDFKKQLISSIEQISVVGTIGELAEHLVLIPSGESEEGIYDKANLYYMVMCLVESNNTNLGALIFKRTKERVHLKGVWDLIPIKHGKVFATNKYSIVDYLKGMLEKSLHINDMPFKDKIHIEFIEDRLRESIVPFSMCNIYRNREVHNGILCVAKIDITGIEVEDFLGTLKKELLKQKRYCDVKLVVKDNIPKKDDSLIVFSDGMEIHSLSLDKVRLDALSVAENPLNNILIDEGECGIAYLSQSINSLMTDDKK